MRSVTHIYCKKLEKRRNPSDDEMIDAFFTTETAYNGNRRI